MGATSEVKSGDIAWLIQTVESLGPALASVMSRLDELENEVSNAVKRRDSVTLGTPSKGGELKCYFDATGPHETNLKAVEEAKEILKAAGGTPANGGA